MDTRYWVKVAWDRLSERGIDPTIEQVSELAIELKRKEDTKNELRTITN